MVKDRTMQLHQGASFKKKGSLRATGEAKNKDELAMLNASSTSGVITKSSNSKEHNEMSAVFLKVREITELIENMKENIVLLKKIHTKMQMSPRIDSKMRERGEELNEAIRSSCMAAKKKMKELDPPTKKDSKAPQTAINRVRTTQQGLLGKMLQDTLDEYQLAVLTHKEISENIIKKELRIVVQMVIRKMPVPAHSEFSDEELTAMLDSQDQAVFAQNYIQETNEAIQSLQDAKDRHSDIIALEKSIEELRDMMVEISIHVHQQGDRIDTIEHHIGNGIIMMERGQKKLSKAHKMMQRARKKKIWIVVCLTSVIGILFLYMALYISLNNR